MGVFSCVRGEGLIGDGEHGEVGDDFWEALTGGRGALMGLVGVGGGGREGGWRG